MASSAYSAVPVRPSRAQGKRWRLGDSGAFLLTLAFATSVLLISILLVYELWIHSSLSRSTFGLGFLVSQSWDPANGQFGALPFIYGTVVTSFVGLAIATPIAVGAAIFLSELAPPRISSALTFMVELLAAVPSVVFGLLAMFTVAPLLQKYGEPFLHNTLGFLPLFKGRMYGVGYLAASVVLAAMVFPFIISISREALLAVPRDQREAALALGATRWETTWQVVVPYARLGIIGSIFLALARALGETMAVTMVIGNDPSIHASLFAPGYTIAAVIANQFTEATGDLYLSSLVELALVLFVLTIVINAVARVLVFATTRRGTAH